MGQMKEVDIMVLSEAITEVLTQGGGVPTTHQMRMWIVKSKEQEIRINNLSPVEETPDLIGQILENPIYDLGDSIREDAVGYSVTPEQLEEIRTVIRDEKGWDEAWSKTVWDLDTFTHSVLSDYIPDKQGMGSIARIHELGRGLKECRARLLHAESRDETATFNLNGEDRAWDSLSDANREYWMDESERENEDQTTGEDPV